MAQHCADGTAGHHGRPDLHRTHVPRRWRPPIIAQARQGGEHAAGPEPMLELVRFRPGEGPPGALLCHSHVRSPIGSRPRCWWGRRPELRPGEAAGMPPGLNQIVTGAAMASVPSVAPYLSLAQISLSLSSIGRGLPGEGMRENERESYPSSPFKHHRDASDQGNREPIRRLGNPNIVPDPKRQKEVKMPPQNNYQ